MPSCITVNQNHSSINYRNSIFSIHNRNYTRLSFQNYNKRIEPLMIKYGLKQDINNLEDGEIDPNDDDDDENEKKSINEVIESKHVTTLVKTMRKKFQKKYFLVYNLIIKHVLLNEDEERIMEIQQINYLS